MSMPPYPEVVAGIADSMMRGCRDLEAAGFDSAFAERLVLDGLAGSGSYREGEWHFADDKPDQPPATLKTNADYLIAHPFWGRLLLGTYEAYPCFQSADVLTYVPDGPRGFATELGARTGKSVAHVRRIPGGGKHDYEWISAEDAQRIGSAAAPFMVEDVTSTGSSPAAMRRLIAGAQSEASGVSIEEAYERPVHVLSALLRAELKPKYLRGLALHVLAKQEIPRDASEFKRRYGIEPVREAVSK